MVFERLTQHFERLLVELGQLIGKQNSVVSQGYFARLRINSSAYKRHLTNSMVWRSERTLRNKRCASLKFSCHTMYLRRLQTL